MNEFVCNTCNEECTVSRPSFDYSATHCTNGNSGTHIESYYSSDCCDSDYKDFQLIECGFCDNEEGDHLGETTSEGDYLCSKCIGSLEQ